MTDLNAALRAAILKALPLQRGPVVEELHTVHGHGVIHEWVPQHEIADAILAAIQPVLDEGATAHSCCMEYGIFQDMSAEGLGQSFRDTRSSLDAAVSTAALLERNEKYPVYVKWRRVTHGRWQVVEGTDAS